MQKKIGYLLMSLVFASALSGCAKKEVQVESNEIPVTTSSNEARTQFNSGMTYLDVGNGIQARKHFTKAIELDPSFASAYIYRAFTSPSNQLYKEDTESAEKNLEGKSEGEKILVSRNKTFLNNNTEERLRLAQQLVEAYPKSARAMTVLGSAYAQISDHNNARASYMKAIELDPNWVGGYVNLGNSLMNIDPKYLKKAEENFSKVVELKPDLSGSHAFLGDVYRVQNNLEKSRQSYENALAIDPNDAATYSRRGHIHSFMGSFEAAISDYRKAMELNPDGKTGSINFEAFTYLYAGDFSAAKKFLEEKANSVGHLGLLESQLNTAKYSFLTNCGWIAFHQNEADELKRLVDLMKPLSEIAGAISGTEEAKLSEKANILLWEAYSLAMKGDYQGALAMAESAKSTLDPIKNPNKLWNYYSTLSYISFKQGKFEESIAHLENANPNGAYNKYMLAKACEMAGQKERAQQIYSGLVDLNVNNIQYALIRKELKDKIKPV